MAQKCKHKFKVLRKSKQATFCGYGYGTLVQCEKCLKVFEISSYDNIIEEVKG